MKTYPGLFPDKTRTRAVPVELTTRRAWEGRVTE